MYGIFTYIWLIFMVNVGIYTIHGWYGICILSAFGKDPVTQPPFGVTSTEICPEQIHRSPAASTAQDNVSMGRCTNADLSKQTTHSRFPKDCTFSSIPK